MKHCAESTKPFKICTTCGVTWPSRDDFLSDSNVVFIGYQVHFADLAAGHFLFNHNCGTTLAVLVAALEDLYDGLVFETRITGTDQCPGYCLRENELEPCPKKCECAFVREIIQILRNWPQTGQM
jgi:hypothetical protein